MTGMTRNGSRMTCLKIDTCQFFRLALRYVNPHEHHSRPCAALV